MSGAALTSLAGAQLRRILWRVVLTFSGGLRVDGELPQSGCVVVANHSSHADTAALLAALPAGRRPLFVAAADYWTSSWWRRLACGALGGGFEVRRNGGGSADLAPLVDDLRAGRVVVLFPEGTRSRDGQLQPFHSGAFRLADAAGVPVVPVGLRGTSELLPVHGEVHRTPVTVRIGRPMPSARADAGRVAVSTLVAQPALRRDSELRRRVAGFAATRAALLLVAAWAVAEAVSWPVVPEVPLVALVLAAPALWWRLSLAAVVGAVVGGVITLTLVGGGVRPPLPLVTDDMRAVVAQDVAASGERAVYRQPFSGIPYKVYATAAGERSLDAATFGVHTAVARGSRFLLVTAAAALLAWSLRRWRHYYPAALSIALAGYLVGLSLVVAGWSS